MDLYNDEHYRDPTAFDAIKRIGTAERRDAIGRLESVLWQAKKIAREYGFEIVGTITGIDNKTGHAFIAGGRKYEKHGRSKARQKITGCSDDFC